MATFTGTGSNDTANADTSSLIGFTSSGSAALDLALLTDNLGDTFLCGPGIDTIVAGSGDDLIEGGAGADNLSGGRGNDTIYAYTQAVPGASSAADIINGDEGNDTLVGGFNADTLYGGNGADTISGNNSADIIRGGAGIDTISGGNGNDTFLIFDGEASDNIDGGTVLAGAPNHLDMSGLLSNSASVNLLNGLWSTSARPGSTTIVNVYKVTGGAGDDTLKGNGSSNILIGGDGEDRIVGFAGNDNLQGGSGNDFLIDAGGADILEGGDGDDDISAGNGFDTLRGGAGADRLAGGRGEDILEGGDDADTLVGSGGGDTMRGEGGDDIIEGNNGNDRLEGQAGKDVLTGGDGQDDFFVMVLSESEVGANRDIITDFVSLVDDIILSGIDAIAGGADDEFLFAGIGDFTGLAGELRYNHVGGNTIVAGDVDGDEEADFEIELTGIKNLVLADFVL